MSKMLPGIRVSQNISWCSYVFFSKEGEEHHWHFQGRIATCRCRSNISERPSSNTSTPDKRTWCMLFLEKCTEKNAKKFEYKTHRIDSLKISAVLRHFPALCQDMFSKQPLAGQLHRAMLKESDDS